MISNNIIKIDQFRDIKKPIARDRKRKSGNKGSVYNRGGKLWVDFRYLGKRVRERTGLDDTPLNRKQVRKQLNLITAEIENGAFKFAKRFPHSKRKHYFTELEGGQAVKGPDEIIFGEYVSKWWEDMAPGMSKSKIRDYTLILNGHLLPYLGALPFSKLTSVQMKKLIVHLQSKKNRYGQPLSAKRIRNILIPARVIVRDAVDEHGWATFHDPFGNLKLPKVRRFRVRPFTIDEWQMLMENMLPWYRTYFEFAVLTGLRPSEQVALKWEVVDSQFVYVELSRVANAEKQDMKTEQSQRIIELRSSMKNLLERQKKMTGHFKSPYVFVNTEGNPMNQFTLYTHWQNAMVKSALTHKRMYETRHTFASWALAAGESPEWVARTLGHVDTSMVYRTYGRYIPNLMRQDGSAFENLYKDAQTKKGNTDVQDRGHIRGHNRESQGRPVKSSN